MTATIEAHGLEKRYGKTRALDGLDLVAEPGQVMAVLGPNGAGKTTFVRAVATLLRLDAGTLRVLGHDVRREPDAVRRLIGLAGQFAAVEPAMTGRENLEMVARLYGQGRRDGARERRSGCSSSSASSSPPTGSSAPTRAACAAGSTSAPAWSGSRGCCCSTSRRPASTRAAGSSSGTRSARSSRAGTDVLLTTQYLDEADQLAGQIVIIDHGRTIADGTPAELKRRVGGNVDRGAHAPPRPPGRDRRGARPSRPRRRADRRGHAPGHRPRRRLRATA